MRSCGWQKAILAALTACSACSSGAGESVARKLEPWWTTGTAAARAAARRQAIQPDQLAGLERAQRTLHLAAAVGEFDGYGQVLILDLFAKADLFHFVAEEKRLRAGLHATYQVLEPANVLLRSNSGSGFWRFENLTAGQKTVFYSGELWDVRVRGVFDVDIPFVSWTSYTGSPFAKGVHEFVGHGMFQMYHPEPRKWRAACNHTKLAPKYPPMALRRCGNIAHDALFTVADLSEYRIQIERLATDWRAPGYVGLELTVTDAAGDTFDLPGADVVAQVSSAAGRHEVSRVELTPLKGFSAPGSLDWRHKFSGGIPGEFFEPQRIDVSISVWVLGPDGAIREECLTKSVTRDELEPTPEPAWRNQERRKDVRTRDGKLMETRFMFVHHNYVKWWETPEKARKTVAAASQAGINVLQVCVYQGGLSSVPSAIMGVRPGMRENVDTFEILVHEAHAAGIEVHPTACCMSGAMTVDERHWAEPQLLKRHPDWAVTDRNGAKRRPADVHRPVFRDLFVRYIADIAERYDIDGFNLDYIRTIEQCFCENCRREYGEATGRDLLDDGAAAPYPQAYVEWQEGAVAALVKGIRDALNVVRPGLWLSTWGHDGPDAKNSFQGRRPDTWLNNGWIDSVQICCYGSDPVAAVADWRSIAARVTRPECVWPTLGSYHGAAYRTEHNAHDSVPIPQTITGDPIHKGVFARRADVLQPMYEAFRDICKLNAFGIFDLCYMTDETLTNTRKLLFPESAVPWRASDSGKGE